VTPEIHLVVSFATVMYRFYRVKHRLSVGLRRNPRSSDSWVKTSAWAALNVYHDIIVGHVNNNPGSWYLHRHDEERGRYRKGAGRTRPKKNYMCGQVPFQKGRLTRQTAFIMNIITKFAIETASIDGD
jgi:hypothetical protein